MAFKSKERTDNIGARRLHTVLERLLEEVSYSASDMTNDQSVDVTATYVDKQFGEIVKNEDLSQYIL